MVAFGYLFLVRVFFNVIVIFKKKKGSLVDRWYRYDRNNRRIG